VFPRAFDKGEDDRQAPPKKGQGCLKNYDSSITKLLSITRTVLRNFVGEPEYWVLITILLY